MSEILRTDPHVCQIPGAHRWGGGIEAEWPAPPVGSIWLCDDCGQHWQVVMHLWMKWVPITDRQARRAVKRAARGADTPATQEGQT